MSQCANRDEINTGFSDFPDVISRNVSRCLQERPALCNVYSMRHVFHRHTIEHYHIRAGIERLPEFIKITDFHLYL